MVTSLALALGAMTHLAMAVVPSAVSHAMPIGAGTAVDPSLVTRAAIGLGHCAPAMGPVEPQGAF